MALFEKQKKQPKKVDLHTLVLELITQGIPKETIMNNLIQAGMDQKDAELLYGSTKMEYDGLFKSEMGKSIKDASDKNKQQIIKELEKEIEQMKRDLDVHLNIKNTEQKEYTDRKLNSIESEVNGIKSDMFSFKVNLEKEIKDLDSEVEEVRLKGFIRVLISIISILTGAVMAILSVTQLYNILLNPPEQLMLSVAIYIVVLIGAVIFGWLGVNVYISEKKHKKLV